MTRIHQLANATLAVVFIVTLLLVSRLYVEERSAKNHLQLVAQTRALPL
jgi:hypothetical protein